MGREELKRAIFELSAVPSVSGFEYRATEEIKRIYADSFDELITDGVGNHTLVRRCARADAPRILVDAHFDEIGMLVSDVLDGGFLRIVTVGGIDPAIMQASDVVVYGKSAMRGVVISVPPHLRAAEKGKLSPVNDLLVDLGLGYTKEELEQLVPIGSPVGYAPVYSEFGEGYLAGKSFDDKACAAIAASAIIGTPREELAGDVYLCLSAREEVSALGGITPACVNVRPHYAMVIDVNLGSAPDTPDRETVELGKGPSIAYSAATDRELTRQTAALCKEKEIAFTPCANPSSTGTNATSVNLVGAGIPVVDIGLPLRNMHTYNEVLLLDDCEALERLVREFICSREIAERFGKEVSL